MSDQYRDGRDITWWEIRVVEEHLHNKERWFGKLGSQTATAWGDAASLSPYRAISGDGVYGADANDEAQVLGSADTPAQTGMITYDPHEILITAYSSTTVYMCRLVWGTGTLSAAVTAGDYTEFALTKPSATGISQGSAVPIMAPRIASGTKIWLQCKNGTNNATLDFLFGIHEYDF